MWSYESDASSYADCLEVAMDNDYSHFSVKENKCRAGLQVECMPTTDNYGWETYEWEMDDCETPAPPTTTTGKQI